MSIEQVVRAEVAGFRPAGPDEEEWQRTFLRFLDELPDPLSRAAGPTHVTASAVVTSPRGVLLHRHRLLQIWLQPGGHLDPGELPWDAAVREVEEETGIPATHPPSGRHLIHLHVGPGGRGHVHLDLRYLLVAPGADPDPPREESQEVAWFSWDDALAVADPALVGALRAAHPAARPSSPSRPSSP